MSEDLVTVVSKEKILGKDSHKGKHGKTSILDLLQGHGILLLLGLTNSKSHRIKSKVSRNAAFISKHGLHGNISLIGPELKDTHPGNNLEHSTGSYNGGGEVGIINVLVSGKCKEFLGNESKGGKHGGTSVLDLCFTEPLHVKVLRESEGVKSNISNVSDGSSGCLDEGEGFGHISIEGAGCDWLGSRGESSSGTGKGSEKNSANHD
mmetsp:Transcript_4577/g.4310  ORF Transcript_4577/g.4310 Transcript_4577/m.4310 type:complete len:207 (+) Transcript_4577:440-1060(+)